MMPSVLRTIILPLLLGLGLLPQARIAYGQTAEPDSAPVQAPLNVAFEVSAGGGLERYLRTLQNVGKADPYPWSLRGFSAGDVRRLSVERREHPWGSRYNLGENGSGLELGWVRPKALTIYNSAFPFGGNDGPLWAGKGLTQGVELGAFARWGSLSLVLAPTVFWTQNREFELAPNGRSGEGIYHDPLTPASIDLPQRFGPEAYHRIDPGNSTLRLDLSGIALGVSTASQQWGPMDSHPLVLGSNAGGFSHVFLGTAHPVNLWIGRAHGRVTFGRLEASDYSPDSPGGERRLMTGLVLVFQPRGIPGLEVGLSRFAHQPWPEELGLEILKKPFATLIGLREGNKVNPDNEMASAFLRWNIPSAGVEIFGEFFRDDGAYDLRTALMEPDDLAGYAMGLRRVWQGQDRLTVLRGEVFSTVSSHRERGGARLEYAQRARPPYKHSYLHQGHTHRGQLLVSPAGHGGQGATLGLDRYSPRGKWSVEWERRLIRDRTVGIGGEDPADADVIHALGLDMVQFRGSVELLLGLRGVYNLNRYLQDDVFNLNVRLGLTVTL